MKFSDELEEKIYGGFYLPLDFVFFFQSVWDICNRVECFFRKKWKPNLDSEKFRLFRAKKAVLSMLSKNPRF